MSKRRQPTAPVVTQPRLASPDDVVAVVDGITIKRSRIKTTIEDAVAWAQMEALVERVGNVERLVDIIVKNADQQTCERFAVALLERVERIRK